MWRELVNSGKKRKNEWGHCEWEGKNKEEKNKYKIEKMEKRKKKKGERILEPVGEEASLSYYTFKTRKRKAIC